MVTILIQNSKTEKLLDISELVAAFSLNTKLEEEPSKLVVSLIESAEIEVINGSAISVKKGDDAIFYGFIFKYGRNGKGNVEITAYDQLRYLKYKDSLILGNKSVGKIFLEVCNIQGIKAKVLDDTSLIVPEKVFDNKTYYEMVKFAIDYNKIYARKYLTILDVAGVLTLVDIEKLKSTTFIGDESLLSDFTFSRSIDDETYNSIKIVHEDSETKELQVAQVADPTTGRLWGALRHFEKVDNLDGTLNALAKNMLKHYNVEQQKLKLNVIGDWGVRAGIAIPFATSKLTLEGFDDIRYLVVESCTHNVSNTHTMDLELRLM